MKNWKLLKARSCPVFQSAQLRTDTDSYEEKEKKLVEDCLQQLGQFFFFFFLIGFFINPFKYMVYPPGGKGIKYKLRKPGSYFVGFSSPYADILCVAGPHKILPQWGSGSLKSVFDRAHATRTRPRFNVPSERRGITFQPKWLTRIHTCTCRKVQNPDDVPTRVWTTDLWYGRHAHYHWAKDASSWHVIIILTGVRDTFWSDNSFPDFIGSNPLFYKLN